VADKTEATLRDAAIIDVDCEACGQHFSYEQIFLFKAEVGYSDPRGDAVKIIKKIAQQMRDGFGKNDYSKIKWQRCPHCGYTQSWMIKRARISQGTRIFLPALIAVLLGSFVTAVVVPDAEIGGMILKYALITAAAIPVVAVAAMLLVFRPNRGRAAAAASGKPGITFAVERPAQQESITVGNMPGSLPRTS